MWRRIIIISAALALAVALTVSCSTKEKVTTGTKYKCKDCGKIYRDDTKTLEVDKSVAKGMTAKTVEGYCPACGDKVTTTNQIQHQKCPVCQKDNGTVTKQIRIERKLSETVPKETEVFVTCPTGKCGRVGAVHAKYNWDWNTCAAVVDQQIGYGFNEEQVRAAWGAPKRTEKMGNATRWYYEAGYVTIGASGKVVEIKQ